MRNKYFILLFTAISVILLQNSFSQSSVVSTVDSLDKTYLNWYNLNPASDKIAGVAVNSSYSQLLANKTSRKKIVVAVIDGGVDINHQDLKEKIWINKDEIPDNGIDDDLNGYIDDIHGWNFIGNSKGENIEYENLEYVRLFRKYDSKFKDVQDTNMLSQSEQQEYTLYLKCKKEYTDKLEEYTTTYDLISTFEQNLLLADSVIKSCLNKDKYTIADIKSIKPASDEVKGSRAFLLFVYKNGFSFPEFKEMKDDARAYLDYRLDTAYNPRIIIADNPEDITDTKYGNNDVKGPDPDHGTFVAGIIAANRSNLIGTDGIAENVEIMSVRTIPNGDERDKDVALAIRYAVDNGAQIINMSFGKDYSPQKGFVDDAIRYANEHNVLLVHASGNDAKDLDKEENYPTRKSGTDSIAINWIEVGASANEFNKNLCGVFSNYGKNVVDLFAPGVNVISLSPGDTYKMGDGTSFSCPVVSGVAALIWSYYPNLTASQLKDILLNSTTHFSGKKVYAPTESGRKIKVSFSDLSKTGGIVNTYNALKLAETISNGQGS